MQSAKRTTTCELIQRRQARLEDGFGTAVDILRDANLQDTTYVACRASQMSQGPRGVFLELHENTEQTCDHTRAAYHLWTYLSDMSQCCIWQ
jgi:hypothetical protein